jgi:hypothetical protein
MNDGTMTTTSAADGSENLDLRLAAVEAKIDLLSDKRSPQNWYSPAQMAELLGKTPHADLLAKGWPCLSE